MTDAVRWHLHRQITLGVVLAFLVQTSGALIWFGRVGERLDQLEYEVVRQEPMAERLARLEAGVGLARESLVRIERRLDG